MQKLLYRFVQACFALYFGVILISSLYFVIGGGLQLPLRLQQIAGVTLGGGLVFGLFMFARVARLFSGKADPLSKYVTRGGNARSTEIHPLKTIAPEQPDTTQDVTDEDENIDSENDEEREESD